MIDVVIPYRSTGNHESLRYALRSLSKYITGVRKVRLIGDMPPWLTDVVVQPFPPGNGMNQKEANICQRVLHVIKNQPDLTDNFLYFHDDHFILDYYPAALFPAYYCGTLKEAEREAGQGPYSITVKNTMEALGGGHVLNFDAHCPLVINKSKFQGVVSRVDWRKRYGYCLKTLYMDGIELTFCDYEDDLKIRKPMWNVEVKHLIEGRQWFSADDKAMTKQFVELLQELYPEKSKWER
jgi:hypothetical protein